MTPWTVALHAPLSIRFPRQKYWSGLPFPSPGDLTDSGIKPVSPALQADYHWATREIFPCSLFCKFDVWIFISLISESELVPKARTIVGCVYIYIYMESESDSHSVMSNSATIWTAAHQALSMEFSRQEYWSGLPFPSPGDLPDPGIKLRSPALQADSLLSEPLGKSYSFRLYPQLFKAWQ